MIRSAEKKNNFFYFWLEKFFYIFWGHRKIFYILGTWDLFPYTPSTLMGVQSVL